MSNIIEAFTEYGELYNEKYFAFVFNKVASVLNLQTPIISNKSNYDKVVKELFTEIDLELVLDFKKWDSESNSNSDFTNDFPKDILFKGKNQSLMVNITLEDDTLEIEFLYDGSDATLEEKVIKKHHQLRSRFGLNKSPSFNVLIHRHSTFSQEEVRTEALDVDLHKNYNDDFIEISETVSDSIKQNNSGMILLHGKPGTGKTTYIKYLISKHREHNFIFVKNEFVDKLLDPDFISFLLKQRNTILIIEDAEKVISSRESKIDNSVVSTILQLTDGLFSDYLNLKIICTFNTHLSKVDTALLRKGRLIALYEFKPLTIEKTHALLESISNDKVEEGMTISDIYNFERKGFTSSSKKIGFN